MKNNTGTDIDVLTKSDGENIFPIKFQPMPKRFMVWDTKSREWLHGDALREFIECNMQHPEDNAEEDIYEMYVGGACKIVQSTNLFDKDGKEIFEGSIIHTLMAKWLVKQDKGCMCAFNYRTGVVMPLYKIEMNATTNIGHILSNPELMEEKAC